MRLAIMAFVIVAVQSEEILKEVQSHRNWKLIDRGDKCGRSKPANRIIGGKEAYLGQFPWIALLYAKYPSNGPEPFCGGSVINERYVITAAHCVLDNEKAGYVLSPFIHFVRLGEHNTSSVEDCDFNKNCAPHVQDIPVDVNGLVYHQEYERGKMINDIALIRLSAPIQFNKFVGPICLPTYDVFQNNNFEGMSMEVAGWGMFDIVVKKSATVLTFIRAPVVDLAKCKNSYVNIVNLDQHRIICAGGVVGKDSCNGDSGGPLSGVFDYGGRPRAFLTGVVSFGDAVCAGDRPAIYTRVSDYLLWILDNIRE